MQHALTQLVVAYNKTGKGLDAIQQQILALAYSFPKQTRYCSEEDCADFLLTFYPRINKIIHTYRTRGTNFEAYLQSCFSWHMKTFRMMKLRQNRQEQILYRENCDNLPAGGKDVWEVREDDPGPLIVSGEETQKPENWRENQKILFLAMKCADDIGDTFINRIASRLGTHSDIVFHLVESLRTTMSGRTQRVRRLREKLQDAHFRLRVLLDTQKNSSDKFRADGIEKQIRREKRRLENTLRILANAPRGPSHSDIARILGVPKGTIDSGLYYLRGVAKKREKK